MKLWPQGLKKQILAITMGLVMGATIISGIVSLLVFYQYAKRHVLDTNQDIATFVASDIDSFMREASGTIEVIANDPFLAIEDGEDWAVKVEPIYSATRIFSVLFISDLQGRVITSVPNSKSYQGRNVKGQSYYSEALKAGKTIISEPIKSLNKKYIVVVASPIRNRQGQITGVVAGSIDLRKSSWFSGILRNKAIDPGTDIHVISKNGINIYDIDGSIVPQELLPDSEFLNLKPGGGEMKINNIPMLVGYTKVKSLGWGVLVKCPTGEALGPAIYLRNLMIIMLILICLLVFLASYMQSKTLIKPLKLLMEGVNRVGDGDYDFNIQVKSSNEIGVLANAFNLMVERVNSMTRDIVRKNRELEKANAELQIMAITDGLTKLYNHRYFQDCLEQAVNYANSENKSVSLMMLDIDHFKYYNDLFGHQAGDRLLEELAELLIRQLGPNDMVARYGGEEFTIILYDSDNGHGLKAAERIRSAVEGYPFPGREQQPEGRVTVSIGVASYPENARNKEELLRFADEALYKAKSCSRNKVELYFSVLDDLKLDLDQSEVELVNSIKMLIRIINAKDKYTYGHCERVGRYAVWIAEKLGLPEDEIKTIKIGAFLHDVGKIEISRGILMKKGALTTEEYEIIKKHPIWGAGIIKAVESLHPTLPVIKYHHERFDGTGYPRSLKGKQIPLHARLLAVADSFDAMTSNRPYCKRKTIPEAVAELRENAGTQFDPEIVEVFLSVLQERQEKVG